MLNIKDVYGNNALMLACVYHNHFKVDIKVRLVQFLLESGADPNIRNYHTGFTPMHWAARWGEVDIVQLLCDNTASEYVPCKKGFTPLDYAGKFGNKEVIIYLVKRLWRNCKLMIKEIKKPKELTKFEQEALKKIKGKNLSKDCEDIFSCGEMIINPIFRSSVLYWACHLSERKFSWV